MSDTKQEVLNWRRTLLDRVSFLKVEFLKLEAQSDSTQDETLKVSLDQRIDTVVLELKQLYKAYKDWIPTIPISRCPICNHILEQSIDHYGIDGLWWSLEQPIRQSNDDVHQHRLAFTGAVELGPSVEKVSYLVSPGPQAPFVVPRLLENPNVVGVMSTLQIGDFLAYPVVYFANPIPLDLELVNEWGSEKYASPMARTDDAGRRIFGWAEAFDDEYSYDFEIAPWIKRGKLLWIAPEDDGLTLQDQIDGCPYLQAKGPRTIMYVQDGDVWSD